MQTNTLVLPAPVSGVTKKVLLAVAALGVAATICLASEIVPIVLGLCCFIVLVAFSRLNITNLILAYVLGDHLCQFLKRMIFMLGDQPKPIYYGFQVMPTLILLIAAGCSYVVLSKMELPLSTKALGFFFLISVLMTLGNLKGAPLASRLAGINQQAIPLLAILAGMALPRTGFKYLARLFAVLTVISVIYGIYQLATGPTSIDKAWAAATHDFSIEGMKVYQYSIGVFPEFRAYSYYADHLTWGLFLVVALIFMLACSGIQAIPKGWLVIVVPLALCGMIASETRAVWVGMMGAAIIYRVITMRGLRRPLLVLTGVVASFALVISLGEYLLVHVHFAGTRSALLNRYLDIGTISARISAWKLFLGALPHHFLLGTGFGSGFAYRGLDQKIVYTAEMYSHNMMVDLLVQTGLPGLVALCIFFYSWLKEAFWVVNASNPTMARAFRWIIALAVGLLLTGSLNGPVFMSSYYFLVLGIVSGEWLRMRAEQNVLRQAFQMRQPVSRRQPVLQ